MLTSVMLTAVLTSALVPGLTQGAEDRAVLTHFIKNRPDLTTALTMFRSGLQSYASKYWSPDMTFDAHYVTKANLTTHLSEKDIMEIVEYQ